MYAEIKRYGIKTQNLSLKTKQLDIYIVSGEIGTHSAILYSLIGINKKKRAEVNQKLNDFLQNKYLFKYHAHQL